ncbi:MAG: decaprenyl-phosphate phosphoribosyltransferase [candidate division KSB1 bacterium]|nr:decaprenyl-phosphate phosphoribosyltransferase [candidate division KSB1 bacterium]
MLRDLFIAMRPRQWSKNILLFAGLLFARDIFTYKTFRSLSAFAIFCLISSAVYLINDVLDRHQDALHPSKRMRPIASGRLSPNIALFSAFFFMLVCLPTAFRLDFRFGLAASAYVIMSIFYSLGLKNVIILDVMIIAVGFVLRAIAGTWVIHEPVSSWLIICTSFLALFIALGKRRAEFIALGSEGGSIRTTLRLYDEPFLDKMITISTAACLMSYALYTLDNETIIKFGTRNLVLTLPLVIYGLFRYLYLIYNENRGEAPEQALLKDVPLMLCVGLYVAAVIMILYF